MTITRRSVLAVSASLFLLVVPEAASAQIADNCDASLWNHVYHPARLTQIHPCIRVIGTVILKRPEKDGDIHIQLKLDKHFSFNAREREGGTGELLPEDRSQCIVRTRFGLGLCRVTRARPRVARHRANPPFFRYVAAHH